MEEPLLSGTHSLHRLKFDVFTIKLGPLLDSSKLECEAEKREVEGERKSTERVNSYQYVGRANSVIPTASLAGTEVSVDEIRSAAASSDHFYPPSLHAPLVSSPEPDPIGNPILYIPNSIHSAQTSVCMYVCEESQKHFDYALRNE